MSIVAKYPATCATCRGRITPGQKIEWTKGQPVRHALCAVAGAPVTGPRRSTGGGICDECQKPRRNLRECRDSSGIVGRCCPQCASLPSYERSFA